MALWGTEPDLTAAHLIPEIDKDEEHKKYKQSMKYFDFGALLAHFLGIIMVVLHGKHNLKNRFERIKTI